MVMYIGEYFSSRNMEPGVYLFHVTRTLVVQDSCDVEIQIFIFRCPFLLVGEKTYW
jgi:hypothetical protein